METHQFNNLIKNHLLYKGYRAEIVDFYRIQELEKDINNYRKLGLFNSDFYNERLSNFVYHDDNKKVNPESTIIIAIPQPIISITFGWKGDSKKVIIPPTYDTSIDELIKRELSQLLLPFNYQIWKVNLPLKLLAAKSGLAQYGKNNVCYINGLGSFFRLLAFNSDVPKITNNWIEPMMMVNCKTCNSCLKNCPTNAIDNDNFIIRAERCLTFHNEHSKRIPDAIDQSVHHCLFGCMKCQINCPSNKKYRNWIVQKGNFYESETDLILNQTTFNKLPHALQNKLEKLNLKDDYSLIPRNLRLLIEKKIDT